MTAEEGKAIVATLAEMGLDAIEISGGIEGRRSFSIRKGIRSTDKEAYFLHLARQARTVTSLPIILVGGFRSRQVMEKVIADGDADFIALCRPLICQPDLPQRMRLGLQDRSECLSANNCWPKAPGEGIACKCPRGLEVR
jgi:2,4-dienoyl-CoA reductase-like NADH-dependent reductase (Old Yellow Enzyme family)